MTGVGRGRGWLNINKDDPRPGSDPKYVLHDSVGDVHFLECLQDAIPSCPRFEEFLAGFNELMNSPPARRKMDRKRLKMFFEEGQLSPDEQRDFVQWMYRRWLTKSENIPIAAHLLFEAGFDPNLRKIALNLLQSTCENLEYLDYYNTSAFYNLMCMLSEILSFRSAISSLITGPFLDGVCLLLKRPSYLERTSKLMYHAVGFISLESCSPNLQSQNNVKWKVLGEQIRIAIATTDDRRKRYWLLLALDTWINRRPLLSHELAFYSTHLDEDLSLELNVSADDQINQNKVDPTAALSSSPTQSVDSELSSVMQPLSIDVDGQQSSHHNSTSAQSHTASSVRRNRHLQQDIVAPSLQHQLQEDVSPDDNPVLPRPLCKNGGSKRRSSRGAPASLRNEAAVAVRIAPDGSCEEIDNFFPQSQPPPRRQQPHQQPKTGRPILGNAAYQVNSEKGYQRIGKGQRGDNLLTTHERGSDENFRSRSLKSPPSSVSSFWQHDDRFENHSPSSGCFLHSFPNLYYDRHMHHFLQPIATCNLDPGKPYADFAKEIDCYVGRADGYAYGSEDRLQRMRDKGMFKPVGPLNMHRHPCTISMDYGWWKNDEALDGVTWYLPAQRHAKLSTDLSKYLTHALTMDKFFKM